jgi:hypothetical protein
MPKHGKKSNKIFRIDCKETDVRPHEEGSDCTNEAVIALPASQSHASQKARKGRGGEADSGATAFAAGTEEEWQEMFRRLGRYATLHGHVRHLHALVVRVYTFAPAATKEAGASSAASVAAPALTYTYTFTYAQAHMLRSQHALLHTHAHSLTINILIHIVIQCPYTFTHTHPRTLQAKVPKNVGEDAGESFGGADFIGLGKWCARQRLLNSSGSLTVEKQQVILSLSFSLVLSLFLSRLLSLSLACSLDRSRSFSLSIALALSLSRSLSLFLSLARSRSFSLSLALALSLSRLLTLSLARARALSLSNK